MEDERIIALYWERAESAITETAAKYGRYCRKIAMNILGNEDDAEECVNDTYLGAWNAMPPHRPKRLSSFLGTITRNIALDRYGYNRATKRNAEFDVLLSELGECVGAGESVEDAIAASELTRCINEFLRSQNETGRIIFIRRYWYADSIEDIAKRFNMTQSRVKSMLFRMRKALKTFLEKEGVVF